jgi:solute:Na+ symporter, SSS family
MRPKHRQLFFNCAVKGLTRPRSEEELKGLVYALTEKAHETDGRWFMRPVPVGICVLILTPVLIWYLVGN